MSELKYVGKNIIRDDVADKATGATKYICDMQKYNMLYAKLYLSEKPHANITIDIKEALKVEGIHAIYTYDDIPKVKYNSHKWYAGVDIYEDEYLISPKACFVGDRLALVIGETVEAVDRALKKLNVVYDELPVVTTINEARKDNCIIHKDTNLAFSKELSCGDYKEKFKSADYIIEDKGYTPKIHHSALETHICLAENDENGNLVIWTPCQVAFQVQTIVAQVLKIPYNKIQVKKAVMGGSFGGKGQPILEPICAFAANSLGRAVKLITDRKTSILATRTRNACEITVKTAITKEGEILAREIITDVDAGAYYTNASAIIMSMGKKAFRLYDIKDQSFKGNSYFTNTLIGGACRGYGSPQIHAITEINIDNAANKLNIDPCEFRLKNVVEQYAKDPLSGADLGNAQIKKCILKGMEAFDWKNRRETIKQNNTDRYAYGIGMACGTHGNGYKGAYPDFTDVDISINPDGNVFIKVAVHEQGCGTIATLKQIAAEALCISVEKINITEADTFLTPYDSAGTQASRVTFVTGGAIKEACAKLKEKIIEHFCNIKKASKDDLILDEGYIEVKESNKKYSYGEVAIMVERELSESLKEYVHYESPANPATYAVCFAEVRVDRYTGNVTITDFLAVHDIGCSINPVLVEGQIQGGAHFSLGMALREEILIDEKGYVKTNNFSKYHLINAPEMPEIKVITIEENEPHGPYGAKSVGEMAAVAPAPAVVNAINNALGTNISSYPVTPENILESIAK